MAADPNRNFFALSTQELCDWVLRQSMPPAVAPELQVLLDLWRREGVCGSSFPPGGLEDAEWREMVPRMALRLPLKRLLDSAMKSTVAAAFGTVAPPATVVPSPVPHRVVTAPAVAVAAPPAAVSIAPALPAALTAGAAKTDVPVKTPKKRGRKPKAVVEQERLEKLAQAKAAGMELPPPEPKVVRASPRLEGGEERRGKREKKRVEEREKSSEKVEEESDEEDEEEEGGEEGEEGGGEGEEGRGKRQKKKKKVLDLLVKPRKKPGPKPKLKNLSKTELNNMIDISKALPKRERIDALLRVLKERPNDQLSVPQILDRLRDFGLNSVFNAYAGDLSQLSCVSATAREREKDHGSRRGKGPIYVFQWKGGQLKFKSDALSQSAERRYPRDEELANRARKIINDNFPPL